MLRRIGLTYVKWYLPERNRFHYRIEEDYRSVNIELWNNDEFYNLSRDSIIPIHNIYGRFVPANFIIGKGIHPFRRRPFRRHPFHRCCFAESHLAEKTFHRIPFPR